jgi:catechol 2,3-dioxygenase-like lactoylglutathione lyase family enzyme
MKLDHLVILLSDLEANLPFYQTLLPLIGFEKLRDHVFANPDGIHLDFRQTRQAGYAYQRFAPGLNHMGFTVSDRAAIERIGRAMSDAGFEVPEIQEFSDGSAMFLKDADGMRVELGTYAPSDAENST